MQLGFGNFKTGRYLRSPHCDCPMGMASPCPSSQGTPGLGWLKRKPGVGGRSSLSGIIALLGMHFPGLGKTALYCVSACGIQLLFVDFDLALWTWNLVYDLQILLCGLPLYFWTSSLLLRFGSWLLALFVELWVAALREVWDGALPAICCGISRAIKESMEACLGNLGQNNPMVTWSLFVSFIAGFQQLSGEAGMSHKLWSNDISDCGWFA